MQEKEMSFWDHLEEFRWTLIRTISALFIFAIIGFIVMPYLFENVILAPTQPDFIFYRALCKVSSHFSILPDFCDQSVEIQIFNIKMATQFFTHMSTSFWLALLLTFPYLIFEVWKFVSPALYENEKKNFRWVFVFGTVMFFLGCAVGYFMVFPMTLRFLATYQLSELIIEQVSLEDYMNKFLLLVFMMGVLFELPLLSWLLSKLGLINRSFFKKFRRHAIVALLVLSAIITPSGDPFTLMVVFLPVYGLYELSAFFVKKAPVLDDDDDDDDDDDEEKTEAQGEAQAITEI